MSELKALAERVLLLEKRVAQLEGRHGTEADTPLSKSVKEMSVKEFILAKRPSNDVEKTLAIGYYLEKLGGESSFNIDDIARHFILAKEATPLNINDKVNMNIRKGHMAETRSKKEKKKAWMLTNSGERFVESGFQASKQ